MYLGKYLSRWSGGEEEDEEELLARRLKKTLVPMADAVSSGGELDPDDPEPVDDSELAR